MAKKAVCTCHLHSGKTPTIVEVYKNIKLSIVQSFQKNGQTLKKILENNQIQCVPKKVPQNHLTVMLQQLIRIVFSFSDFKVYVKNFISQNLRLIRLRCRLQLSKREKWWNFTFRPNQL